MKPRSPTFSELPLKLVCSSKFGRYPKISIEQVFNMIQSDGWMVPYAGYKNILAQNAAHPFPNPINPAGKGRGIWHSTITNSLYEAIGNQVYRTTFNPLLTNMIGTLGTFTGDVFFAEDIRGFLCICDKVNIYSYSGSQSPNFKLVSTDFKPGYVSFHNGRFNAPDLNSSQWRLSDPSQSGVVFPTSSNAQFVGQFQPKADQPLIVVPLTSRSNNVLILGSFAGQTWTDVGAALFPYQLNAGYNLDYGIANADTFASLDYYSAWIAINEKAGPSFMVSNGGIPERISTDGIDFLLSHLGNPQDSHGFFIRQDGHLIYQACFPSDNVSFIYDFNTKKFSNVSDEYFNYHPAKRVAAINNTYYFVSLNDGNLYQFDSSITNYNYGYNSQSVLVVNMQPRVVFTETLRMPDTDPFIANNLSFPIEQGVDQVVSNEVASVNVTAGGMNYSANTTVTFIGGSGSGATAVPVIASGVITGITITNAGYGYVTAPSVVITDSLGSGASAYATTSPIGSSVDLAVSRDGGEIFSNFDNIALNTLGNYRNRFNYYQLGWGNEITFQFRFWSYDRIVFSDGILGIYQ